MDIIIICHTEFGFVYNKELVFDKNATRGVKDGVLNLIQLADKYRAKITFVVCPEVVNFFPKNIEHEIGLHIHPGWKKHKYKNFQWYVGDAYLKEHCEQSINSTILIDYSYEEQLGMIRIGKEYLKKELGREPKVFVAGRWSLNNDTITALIETGFTHDCSASAHSKSDHHNWSKLPRICLPYYPSKKDYQEKGDLPLLIVPISQFFSGHSVNVEFISAYGLSWLKASFLEYYKQNVPLFHICLHSPSMTDSYYISAMDDFLSFISRHKNIKFKFASEIKEYEEMSPKTNLLPYFFGINGNIIKTFLKRKLLRI